MERLKEESRRLTAEAAEATRRVLALAPQIAAAEALRDRLLHRDAATERLREEEAEARAAASEAGQRVAPLLEAAEKIEPLADELTHADAEVAALSERRDELAAAERVAGWEMRHDEAARIGEELERVEAELDAALTHRGVLQDRAIEAARLRVEAQEWADEQARLLEVAEAKLAELADLPDKLAREAAAAEQHRALIAQRRPVPSRPGDQPVLIVGRDAIVPKPTGATLS